jgi:hypothetical protein
VQFATLKVIINVCVILLLKMGREKQSYTCENDLSISWKLTISESKPWQWEGKNNLIHVKMISPFHGNFP